VVSSIFIAEDVFEFGLLPFEHQTLRGHLVHLSLGREEGLHHAVMRLSARACSTLPRQDSITLLNGSY
jgi:hypothetical protein